MKVVRHNHEIVNKKFSLSAVVLKDIEEQFRGGSTLE